MEIRICAAEEKHIPQILEIEKLCFSVPFTESQLRSQMPDDSHVFITAEDVSGNVLGYVGMMYVLDEGYISNVATHPGYRCLGIGDRLINELIQIAKLKSLAFITLEVRESNEPAKALYGKHGFTEVGRRKNYYTQPSESAILMTLFI